jgi:D-tyrosyl-tRNA(Tyr) deacylase
VLQRVLSASVRTGGEEIASIGPGLLVYAATEDSDDDRERDWLAAKLVELRIFADSDGRMNLSLAESGGALLLVPQFTLYADTRKGRRPSFFGAAAPDIARPRLESLAGAIRSHGIHVEEGRFGADMAVESVNDGPVTIVLDSADLDRARRSSH